MFWRKSLLAALCLTQGCYDLRIASPDALRSLQPEGLRASPIVASRPPAGGKRETREEDPPHEVEVVLKSGEHLRLKHPFVIAEFAPDQFRLTDQRTPVQTLSLDQIDRVKIYRVNATGTTVAAAIVVPLVLVSVVVLYALHPGRGHAYEEAR